MPIIHVRKLQPGMILAAQVNNFLGNTLLKSGVTISEKHIITLKSWGIKSIAVEGENQEDSQHQADTTNSAQKVVRDLDRVFSTVKDQPIMQMIYQIVKKQALKARSSS